MAGVLLVSCEPVFEFCETAGPRQRSVREVREGPRRLMIVSAMRGPLYVIVSKR